MMKSTITTRWNHGLTQNQWTSIVGSELYSLMLRHNVLVTTEYPRKTDFYAALGRYLKKNTTSLYYYSMGEAVWFETEEDMVAFSLFLDGKLAHALVAENSYESSLNK